MSQICLDQHGFMRIQSTVIYVLYDSFYMTLFLFEIYDGGSQADIIYSFFQQSPWRKRSFLTYWHISLKILTNFCIAFGRLNWLILIFTKLFFSYLHHYESIISSKINIKKKSISWPWRKIFPTCVYRVL